MSSITKVPDVRRTTVFSQDNVIVSSVSPVKSESAYSGNLQIICEDQKYFIKWTAMGFITAHKKDITEQEDLLGWEDISSVGYKVAGYSDCIEFKTGIELPKVIFDVHDCKSLQISLKSSGEVTGKFNLIDGSSVISFCFKNNSEFSDFLNALQLCMPLKKSKIDDSVFVVEDKTEMKLDKTFSGIQLKDESKTPLVAKMMKNPYETALGSFSKVTSFLWDNILYPNSNEQLSECKEDTLVQFLTESLSRAHIDEEEGSGYELITKYELPVRPAIRRSPPVSFEEWNRYVDSDGRIKNQQKLKQRIFKGGLINSLRCELWKFLLGYLEFDSTAKEQELKRKQKEDYYYKMKLQWKTITTDQESRFSAFRERRSLVGKDVNRTDRTHPFFQGDDNIHIKMLYDILMTYCMYNFDLGYVQGMSDLVSPILVVMQNESDSFWCFAKWMEEIGDNFEMDQQGIKSQLLSLHRLIQFSDTNLCEYLDSHDSGNLYFAFKWLLILFKRDFKFEEIMRLWEVLWTKLPCKNFHLLICLAILDTEKPTIIEIENGYEILKHINDLAYKINLDEILCKAEAIYEQIINCSYLPNVVQDILGLDIPLSIDSPALSDVGSEKSSAVYLDIPGKAVKVKEVETGCSTSIFLDTDNENKCVIHDCKNVKSCADGQTSKTSAGVLPSSSRHSAHFRSSEYDDEKYAYTLDFYQPDI